MRASREMFSKRFLGVVTPATVLTLERLDLHLGAEEVSCIMLATSVVPESLSIVESLVAHVAHEFSVHLCLLF